VSILLAIPKLLRDLDPTAINAVMRDSLSSNHYKNIIPPRPEYPPTAHERMGRAYHEAAHGVAAFNCGCTAIELVLRADATGQCINSPPEKLEDRIMVALTGVIAESKFRPQSIHQNLDPDSPPYDFVVARRLIDSLNASGDRLPLSFTSATRTAIKFCDTHWMAIGNVAAALDDAGVVEDFAVRIFAKCRP